MNVSKTSFNNVGTGKLYVKNHMEQWCGLGGKSLRIFSCCGGGVVAVVFFMLLLFSFCCCCFLFVVVVSLLLFLFSLCCCCVVFVFFYVHVFVFLFWLLLCWALYFREVFWEKGVLKIFKIDTRQIGIQTKSFEKYLWEILFW